MEPEPVHGSTMLTGAAVANCGALTPNMVAELVRELPSQQEVQQFLSTAQDLQLHASTAQEFLTTAQEADARGDTPIAADAYMDLVELEGAKWEEAVIERYKKLYPMGTATRDWRNHSDTFREAMSERVARGEAAVLSAAPPIFLLHNLVSAEEAAEIRAVGARRRAQWSRSYPRVCFQHDAYTGHAGLTGAWEWMSGRAGRGGRGCLTQAASRRVAGT